MCMDTERVARRVKSLRIDKGWTQSDLAAESGVSLGSIARVEQARGCMSLEMACGIADALGCTLDVLACRDVV